MLLASRRAACGVAFVAIKLSSRAVNIRMAMLKAQSARVFKIYRRFYYAMS
jgi:hypothetical protein